jgi:glycosyltransferase involved in cell wall biosynthesis
VSAAIVTPGERTPPVCSVVVPSFRSASTIRPCLLALRAQDLKAPFEVILVDSGDDETAAVAREEFPEVQVVRLPERTEAPVARNLGAQRARGHVLAFVDSDCRASPDWLRRLYDTIQQGYTAAGGAIVNANGDTLASWAGYFCEFREFLPEGSARDADDLTEGNVAYRRQAFHEAGGFPVDCFPQEGQLFHRALRARGARLRLDPSIVVSHTHRSRVGAFVAHQRRIGRTNARVLRRLGSRGSLLARSKALALVALPALVPYRFVRTVRACRRAERGLVLRTPALLALIFLGTCSWGRGFCEGAGAS